jgi:osmotically-inducible protein OsmY
MLGRETIAAGGTAVLLPPPPRRASAADLAERELRGSPYLALRNVTCDGRDGVLTLRGCLPTYYLKQVAQAVVARVEGVRLIVNEIDVVGGGMRDKRRD